MLGEIVIYYFTHDLNLKKVIYYLLFYFIFTYTFLREKKLFFL